MILSLERPIHTIQHTSGGKPLLTILTQKIEINQHGVVPKIVSRIQHNISYIFQQQKSIQCPFPLTYFAVLLLIFLTYFFSI